MNSREIGNCAFDLCHPRTAIPASGKMGTNSSGAAGGKFAVRGHKKFFVLGMKVFAQHRLQPPPARCNRRKRRGSLLIHSFLNPSVQGFLAHLTRDTEKNEQNALSRNIQLWENVDLRVGDVLTRIPESNNQSREADS